MSDTVTVGLDGTRESASAADWAAQEACRRGATLRLVQVRETGAFPYSPLADDQVERRWARELADRETEHLLRRYPKLRVTRQLVSGHPAHVLADLSADSAVMVLGSRGLGSVLGFMVGNVGLPTVAHVHCPVVLVRARPPAPRVRHGPLYVLRHAGEAEDEDWYVGRGIGQPGEPGEPGEAGQAGQAGDAREAEQTGEASPEEAEEGEEGEAGAPEPGGPVVLGVDLDRPSDDILAFAFETAARNSVPLRVLYGWHLPPASGLAPHPRRTGETGDASGEKDRELTRILSPWQRKFPEVALESQALPGRPARLLVEAAPGASLVVIGRRVRRSRIGNHIGTHIGPTTHAVMHHARTPVAIVPHD
jgi:nucleotide-binding universal stress UspA family protein